MLRAAGNYADPAGPRAAFRGAGPARRCARVLPHPRARRKLHLLLSELRMVALRGDLRPLRQHRAIHALPHRRAVVYTDSRIVESAGINLHKFSRRLSSSFTQPMPISA